MFGIYKFSYSFIYTWHFIFYYLKSFLSFLRHSKMCENLNIFNDIDPDTNHFDFSENLNHCTYFDIDNFISAFNKSNNCFSILNFNIRSFSKNIDELLAILSNCRDKPDIIVLSETWAHNNTFQLCNISGYSACHSLRSDREGGGVAVYVKNSIKFQSLDININNNVIECIGVKLTSCNKVTNILGIYRPPAGNTVEFVNELEYILDFHKLNKKIQYYLETLIFVLPVIIIMQLGII